MDITNLKYNVLLMKTKARLERELKETNRLLNEQQEKCEHVNVILGFSGCYPCRETIYCRCLLCGEREPAELPCKKFYEPIDAIYYKRSEYHLGQCTRTRDKKFEEIHNLWMQYVTDFPELTIEELIEKMKETIANESKVKVKKEI